MSSCDKYRNQTRPCFRCLILRLQNHRWVQLRGQRLSTDAFISCDEYHNPTRKPKLLEAFHFYRQRATPAAKSELQRKMGALRWRCAIKSSRKVTCSDVQTWKSKAIKQSEWATIEDFIYSICSISVTSQTYTFCVGAFRVASWRSRRWTRHCNHCRPTHRPVQMHGSQYLLRVSCPVTNQGADAVRFRNRCHRLRVHFGLVNRERGDSVRNMIQYFLASGRQLTATTLDTSLQSL